MLSLKSKNVTRQTILLRNLNKIRCIDFAKEAHEFHQDS